MKKLLFLCILLPVGLVAIAQPTDTLETKERIKIADSLFSELGQYQQALVFYDKAAQEFEAKSNIGQYFTYKLRVAQCYYLLSNYDDAAKLSQLLLKKARPPYYTTHSLLLQGKINNLLGEIFYKKGRYQIARKYLEKALEIFKYEEDGELLLSVVYTRLGFVHEAFEDFNAALKHYKKALALRKRLLGVYHRATAASYGDLANVYFAGGDYKNSIKYDLESLRIKRKLYGEQHPDIALSYNNIASTYSERGDFDMALRYHQKALYIRKTAFKELHLDIGQSYNNIGYTYMQKGAYDLALEYYYKYLHILRIKLGKLHPKFNEVYGRIGTIYVRKKQYQLALSYFEKNLVLLRKIYPRLNTRFAEAYHHFGYAYRLKKDYPKAIIYFKEALKIMAMVFDKPHIYTARSYLNLGRTYLARKKNKQAIQYLNKSLQTLRQLFDKKSHLHAVCNYELGKLYLQQKKPHTSLQYLQKALVCGIPPFNDSTHMFVLPKVKDIPVDPFLIKILDAKAQAMYQLYLYEKNQKFLDHAIESYELAYHLLQKVDNSYVKTEDRMYFYTTVLNIRDGAIKAYQQKHKISRKKKYLDKIFEYSERFKANVLKSSLQHQKALKTVNMPNDVLATEKDLRQEINHWQKKLSSNPQKTPQHQDSLFKYNRKYETLITQLEKNYPSYARLKSQNKTVRLANVQKKLQAGDLLLEYTFGKKNSHLFIMTPQLVKVIPLAKQTTLQPLLDAYYNALANEERLSKFAKASHRLYNALLKPARQYLQGKKRLIIIAPSLESTPFEAIITQRPSNNALQTNDFSQLAYLTKQYQISYHYSATLWYRGLNSTRKITPKFLAFAPFSTGKSKVLQNTNRRINDSLPESGIEVKAIFKLFRRQNLEAQVFLSKAATKERFLRKAKDYNMIHIASHSEANTQNANFARIYFAGCDYTKTDASGCLLTNEIYNLGLNADLLVLSSCESGVGKLTQGEGVLSLARGFLHAGVRNIIFSLWEVNDTYTRKLMVVFYKELLAGKSYREALQAAQQLNLRSNKKLHPKHWAGFVMIGE